MSSSHKGLNLLIFDGGGVPQGLMQLMIIREIMLRIQTHAELDKIPIPADWFDLIAGVGIGGIISLLLGRFRLSVETAIEEYNHLASTAFSSTDPGGFFETKWLHRAMKALSQKYTDTKEARLLDSKDKRCHVFLCASNPGEAVHARNFRTYLVERFNESDCTIWEAAHATLAACSMFPGIEIGGEVFGHGSTGYYNPINEALKESEILFGKSRAINSIVTIGSGKGDPLEQARDDKLLIPPSIKLNLKMMGIDSERVAREIASRLQETDLHFRFNFENTPQFLEKRYWGTPSTEKLLSNARTLLGDEAISQQIDGMVIKLTQNTLDGLIEISDLNRIVPPEIPPKARPPLSHSYVERQSIEDSITKRIFGSNLTSSPSICVVYGVGGSGKTQTVLHLLRKWEDCLWRIFYVDASNAAAIESDLETAIRSLGQKYKNGTWKDAITHLSFESRPWVLVLDNADDPNLSLRKYIPNAPRGKVIITSRNQQCIEYSPEGAIQVGELDQAEAVTLLHKTARMDPRDKKHSIEIVQELGFLALAIVQAGGYIASTGRFEDYLTIFRNHRAKLMRKHNVHQTDTSVYATIELSFDQLDQTCQNFMHLCGFLHYSSIPQKLFEIGTKNGFKFRSDYSALTPPKDVEEVSRSLQETFGEEWDLFSFDELIEPLRQRSLMSMSESAGSDTFFHSHPLVLACVRDHLKKSDQAHYIQLAVRLLSCAITRGDSSVEYAWRKQLLPHITAVKFPLHEIHPVDALSFARAYEDAGNWETCEQLRKHSLGILKSSLGDDHLETLSAMISLSTTLRLRGQLEEAEKLQRDVLKIRQNVLGPSHPHTILAMNALCITIQARGHQEDAEILMREVVDLQRQAVGPMDSATLTAMHNLATILTSRGLLEEAEKLHLETFELQKMVLGPLHVDTLLGMSGVATIFQVRGRLDEAQGLRMVLLKTRSAVQGEEHPQTISEMNSLASIFQTKGRLGDAEKLYRTALALRKNVLGAQHLDTLLTMNDLGNTLQLGGKIGEAVELQRDVLKYQKQVLGSRHPDTISSMHNLAVSLTKGNQMEEAEQLQETVLTLRTEILGVKHFDTIKAMNNLSGTYIMTKRFSEAEELQRKVVKLRKEVLGLQHRDTSRAILQFASILQQQEKFDEAEAMFREAIGLLKQGRQYPETIAAMKALTMVLSKLGRLEEAEPLGRELLAICKAAFGPDHGQTLDAMERLASTLRGLGRTREAREVSEEAMEIRLGKMQMGLSPHQFALFSALMSQVQ